eukprot:9995019-Prorocentrum_lima.AAC.1
MGDNMGAYWCLVKEQSEETRAGAHVAVTTPAHPEAPPHTLCSWLRIRMKALGTRDRDVWRAISTGWARLGSGG